MRLPALFCLFLVALPAAAQTADREANVDLARRHFQSGSAYFEEGRFDDAAREFQDSYHLAPRVDLLYNIAQCYLRKGDAARAIDFYRRYLDGKPEASDRPAIERTIAGLRQRVGSVRVEGAPDGSEVIVAGWDAGRAPLAQPVTVTAGMVRVEARLADGSVRSVDVNVSTNQVVAARIPAPAEKVVVKEKVVEKVVERRGPKWWDSTAGWTLSAIGAALAIGGVVVALPVASSVGNGAQNATVESDWHTTRSNAGTVRDVGIGVAAAGGAALAVGVTLFALKYRKEASRVSLLVAPALAPDGAGVFARGSF